MPPPPGRIAGRRTAGGAGRPGGKSWAEAPGAEPILKDIIPCRFGYLMFFCILFPFCLLDTGLGILSMRLEIPPAIAGPGWLRGRGDKVPAIIYNELHLPAAARMARAAARPTPAPGMKRRREKFQLAGALPG